MKNTVVICISLIAGSVGLFFWSFYQYLYLMGNEYELAEFVAKVISLGGSKEVSSEQILVPGSQGITEERAIIAMFALACLGALCAFGVATYQRFKHGCYRLYIPLVFCSLCLIGCVLFTGYRYGLDYYA